MPLRVSPLQPLQPMQPLQLQVRPPALYAVSAALLMLGEVAEPPKAWRSLGPRLGKKDSRGSRLPWRRRLLKRLAAFDPLGMSEARVERVQALLDLLPQAQVELVINVPFLLAKHSLVAVRLWRLARLPATSQEGGDAMALTTGLVRSQAMAAHGLWRPSARTRSGRRPSAQRRPRRPRRPRCSRRRRRPTARQRGRPKRPHTRPGTVGGL